MTKYYIEQIVIKPLFGWPEMYQIYLNNELYCNCSTKYLPGCIKGIVNNAQTQEDK